jgi:hypothetical protein
MKSSGGKSRNLGGSPKVPPECATFIATDAWSRFRCVRAQPVDATPVFLVTANFEDAFARRVDAAYRAFEPGA